MSAQKSRGADMESGGLMQRIRALIPILIPLFVSSFRRAYDLAMAMECRCYHGGEGRTKMKSLHIATPVSYTHLDVYKRQPVGHRVLQTVCCAVCGTLRR